jgi:hypothetical protein
VEDKKEDERRTLEEVLKDPASTDTEYFKAWERVRYNAAIGVR